VLAAEAVMVGVDAEVATAATGAEAVEVGVEGVNGA